MDSISVFGLSFPLLPLLMVSSLLLLSALNRWPSFRVAGFSDAILLRLLLSLVVARLVFVSQHMSGDQGQWWQVLDIRDRGFDSYSLLLVFSLLLMHYAYQEVAARRLLRLAVPLILLWMGGSYTLFRYYQPLSERWPPLVFNDLQGQSQRFSQEFSVALDGTMNRSRTSESYRFTLVNLWASWCPPCRAEMPELMQAAQQYPDGRFIMLNQGEDPAQILRFLQQEQLEFAAVWLDPQRTMGRWLGQQALPVTLIFDDEGQLIDGHAGVLSQARLTQMLRDR